MKNTKTDTTKYVNRRERLGGLIYVLLFFLVGAGACSWLLLAQSDMQQIFARKNLVSAKMNRQQTFSREQVKSSPDCDLIVTDIGKYDPGVNAVYEKNDIQFMINELQKHYEDNRSDKRYRAYLHVGAMYQMWFNDRQYLWSLQANLSYIKQNLDDCELGLDKKQDALKKDK